MEGFELTSLPSSIRTGNNNFLMWPLEEAGTVTTSAEGTRVCEAELSISCLQSHDSEDDFGAFRTDPHEALGTVHVSPPKSSLSVFWCECSIASSSTVHFLGPSTVRRSRSTSVRYSCSCTAVAAVYEQNDVAFPWKREATSWSASNSFSCSAKTEGLIGLDVFSFLSGV